MKRILLLVLVVGVLAGQASAGMFTFTKGQAMSLSAVKWSDVGGNNMLFGPTDDAGDYGSPMQGLVGFYGNLDDVKATKDLYAYVQIGANYPGGPGVAGLLGDSDLRGYAGYQLFLANDNQSNWEATLYIVTSPGVTVWTTPQQWTELGGGTGTTLELSFSGLSDSDLEDVQDIGFGIRGHLIGNSSNMLYPSDPDTFHISAVPVPAGVLLGFLGLGAAGLGLRKFAV